MKTLLLYLCALLLLPACVSPRLARSNLDAVEALGRAAVETSPDAAPIAEDAAKTALELLGACSAWQQALHLGVPTELTEANLRNVQDLGEFAPEQRALSVRALRLAEELAERARSAERARGVVSGSPWLAGFLEVAKLAGAGIALLYGGTRGQKHVRAWWNEAPAQPPSGRPAEAAA